MGLCAFLLRSGPAHQKYSRRHSMYPETHRSCFSQKNILGVIQTQRPFAACVLGPACRLTIKRISEPPHVGDKRGHPKTCSETACSSRRAAPLENKPRNKWHDVRCGFASLRPRDVDPIECLHGSTLVKGIISTGTCFLCLCVVEK
jgi:hypothetical protein